MEREVTLLPGRWALGGGGQSEEAGDAASAVGAEREGGGEELGILTGMSKVFRRRKYMGICVIHRD